QEAATNPGQPWWLILLQRLAIWGVFFAVLYLARDFFFVAFMTFLFSYLTLAVVGRGMQRLSPAPGRPGVRRLLVGGVLVLGALGPARRRCPGRPLAARTGAAPRRLVQPGHSRGGGFPPPARLGGPFGVPDEIRWAGRPQVSAGAGRVPPERR